MNILVVSRVSIPAKDRVLPAWEYLRSLGHNVTVEHPGMAAAIKDFVPDVLIGMGVTVMEECFLAVKRFPGVPMYQYMWDCYHWVWEPGQEGKRQASNPSRPGEYDYRRYGDLLRLAEEVWVPSKCTGLRTTQWWSINNWHVILSACPWWDWPPEDEPGGAITDGGYALCTLREIPDPYWGRLETACKELNIPLTMTRHEVSYREYQRAVANCRFLVSDLYELSTGGLTLLEGYYLGKPCLLSNSPWHGGVDYMGGRASYFQHDSNTDLKEKLRYMYEGPAAWAGPPKDCREWVTANFSDKRMMDDMLGRIQSHRAG